MKINNKNSFWKRKKTLLTIVLIATLIAIGAIMYMYLYRDPNAKNDINYAPPTSSQKKAGKDAKQNAIERDASPTQSDTTATDDDLIKISAVQNTDTKEITVTTKLDNSISWDKCFLDVVQGAQTKTFEARTVYQQASSFCGGFSIPSDGMSGTWNLTLKVTELDGKIHEVHSSVDIL